MLSLHSSPPPKYLLSYVPLFSQGTHYIITGLLFGCKYSVSVAPVAAEEDLRSEAVAWVTTPACSSVKGRGAKAMPCVGEGVRSCYINPHTHQFTLFFLIVNNSKPNDSN